MRWYKDDILIIDSSEELPIPEGVMLWENGSLEIFQVQSKDTGIYVCEIVRTEPWAPIRQRHAIEVLREYFDKQFKIV